jgi:hypothetical protein
MKRPNADMTYEAEHARDEKREERGNLSEDKEKPSLFALPCHSFGAWE